MTAIRTTGTARGVPSYLKATPRRMLGLSTTMWRVLVIAAAALVVEMAPRVGLIDTFTMVPFSSMVTEAARLLLDGGFYAGVVWPSLFAVLVSFVVSSVTGVLLGYVIWRAGRVRRAVDPYLTAYYAIPTFALYPLLVTVWGTGRPPIIALAVVFSVVAVITNAMNGYDSVPRTVRKMAVSMRVSELQYFTKFFLPFSIPYILVGLRLAFLYSILSVLAAEFLLSNEGLGYLVSNAYVTFQTADMYAGILVILLLAVLAERFITFLVNRLTWVGSLQ